jgi:hypothetical protein
MKDSPNFETLRARYRSHWDAFQVISLKNAAIVRAGQKPSDAQLEAEDHASAAVEFARGELLAAISTLGH